MDLIYRGRRYTALTQSVRSHVGPQGGHYRGLAWYQRWVETVPQQPILDLCYRGIFYHTNRIGQAIAADQPQSRSQTPAWARGAKTVKAKAKVRTKKMTQVALRHHDALVSRLEKRMAAARQQGNAELMKVLEYERQQLA